MHVPSVSRNHGDRFAPEPGERGQVGWLAATDPAAALGRAREMMNPWYKVQALASVAEYQPTDALSREVLEEAFIVARDAEDGYRRAGCAVWAFAVAVNRGMHGYAREVLSRPGGLLDQLVEVTPESSVCELLCMLIDASLPLGREVYEPLVRIMVNVAVDVETKRGDARGPQRFKVMISQLNGHDPSLAQEIVATYPLPEKRPALEKRLAEPIYKYRFFDPTRRKPLAPNPGVQE